MKRHYPAVSVGDPIGVNTARFSFADQPALAWHAFEQPQSPSAVQVCFDGPVVAS